MKTKKIIICFLAFLMLFDSIPVYALVQSQSNSTETYEHQFTILKWGKDEMLFRAWASKLLTEYLRNLKFDTNEKSPLKGMLMQNLEAFKQEYQLCYYIDAYDLKTSGFLHDSCDYHAYYELADQKFQFDTMRGGAARVNLFGNVTRLVDYSVPSLLMDDNNEELKEIFYWFMLNTIKEKSEAASKTPGKLQTQNGLMVFDTSSGRFEEIELMDNINESSNSQAGADFIDAAVKMTETVLDGYVVYQKVLIDIESGVLKNVDFGDIELEGVPGSGTLPEKLKGILKKMMWDVLNTGLHAVLDSADDIVQAKNNEIQKAVDNLNKIYIQDEFKKELVNINEWALQFMSEEFTAYSEYGEQDKINTFGSYLKEEFDELQHILTDDEIMQNITNDPSVKLKLNEAMNFQLDDVMNVEQLKSYYIMIVIDHVMECAAEVLFGSLASGVLDVLDEFLKDFQKNGQLNKYVKNITDAVKNYISDIKNEFKARMKKASEKTLKELKLERTGKENLDVLINQFCNRFFEKFAEEMDPSSAGEDADMNIIRAADDYGTYCKNALINQIFPLIFNFTNTFIDENVEDYKDNPNVQKEKDPISVIFVAVIKAIGAGVKDYYFKEITGANDKRYFNDMYGEFTAALSPYDEGEGAHGVINAFYALQELAELLYAYHEYCEIHEIIEPDIKKIIADPGFNQDLASALGAAFDEIAKNGDLWELMFKKISKVPDIKKNVAMPVSIMEKAKQKFTEIAGEIGPTVIVMFQVMGKYVSGLWKSAKTAGTAFWKAYYSVHDSVTNEDELSFEAAISYFAKLHSKKLEDQLKRCENAYRSKYAPSDYVYLQMRPEDIMDANLTPDLDEIHLLTRLILMQNDFDVVGMGSYYSISAKYRYYRNSDFGDMLSGDILESETARNKYNSVVSFGNKYKRGVEAWNNDWNLMFTY